ncbi:chemotaxis regulatory protein ChePep [Helicobacter pylori]
MKMILFNQNPMIEKLLESVSKKLELSIENFNHYQELSVHLKKDPEWLLIADDECLEKLDQIDWLELKEIISQNKNSVCMYKKGHEAQPFLEGFEMKIKKPFLPTEMLKVLQKKLGSNASELEPSQNLDPTQEVLETNWDELENLGDLEALAKEEPNNEEQLLPTLNDQEEKEEVKKTPQEEEKPKDDETQEGETLKDKEVSKELETQEEVKEETQEEVKEETQEEVKEETQENKEEKQEKTQDSPSTQELEAMQELVKEIQENSNENKKETQEKETQEDHYESIEDIPEPVMAKAMGEELPFLNEAVAKTPNNENNTETPKESDIKTPQEKEESDKTSSPLELRLNLQDLLKSLNQESLKSLLENKTLSIKITLEDKKPNA